MKKLSPDLVVVKYDELLGYDYTLALNKYNTLPDHVRPFLTFLFHIYIQSPHLLTMLLVFCTANRH